MRSPSQIAGEAAEVAQVADMVEFEVGEAEAGHRLDVAIAAVTAISRAQARRWIDTGCVEVDGTPVARASRSVALGESVRARPPRPVEASAEPEAIALSILYEDDDLIVIDKPAGLVVHPAPGHPRGTLVNALLHHCGAMASVGGVLRPGIVHRLDRGTSGVMVAAKSDQAHRGLAQQFHDHSIERLYLALVRASPTNDEGLIDAAIGRHPRDRKRMSTAARAGRSARTAWRVRERFEESGRAWLEVRPQTGRTHQIRVHLASVGLPIVGDPVYGRSRAARAATPAERSLDRPALHAALLGIIHPRTGEPMRFEAPVAPELQQILDELARRSGEAGVSR